MPYVVRRRSISSVFPDRPTTPAGDAAASPVVGRAQPSKDSSPDAHAGPPAQHRKNRDHAATSTVGKVKAPSTPITALYILKYELAMSTYRCPSVSLFHALGQQSLHSLHAETRASCWSAMPQARCSAGAFRMWKVSYPGWLMHEMYIVHSSHLIPPGTYGQRCESYH